MEVCSGNHCIAHAHKAKPNVIQCSENTLGSRTRESQFFYVWLALLLPVMFRIIVVRSKANSIHKFPQLVGLKISHRYDGLQLIQTLQISAGFSIAWNMSQTTTDCMPFWNRLKEPKTNPKSSRALFYISHLKRSNMNSIDNVRPKNRSQLWTSTLAYMWGGE